MITQETEPGRMGSMSSGIIEIAEMGAQRQQDNNTGKERDNGKANRMGNSGESGCGKSGLAVVGSDRGGALRMGSAEETLVLMRVCVADAEGSDARVSALTAPARGFRRAPLRRALARMILYGLAVPRGRSLRLADEAWHGYRLASELVPV